MKSAHKLFSILENLCVEGDAGVTELSLKLDQGKSAIHRFLSVLSELGYVKKNSDNGKYYATLKVFEIGAMVRGRLRLVNLARPYMEELGKKTNETINLALFEQGEVVYIDKVESVETLRMDLAVGRRVPAYCTALGKVFLANLSKDEVEGCLQSHNYKSFTERTINSSKELKRNLDNVKKEGIAIDDRELDKGIRCIAAPVCNELGKVIAAVSIAGPSIRMTFNKLKFLRKPLIDATLEISRRLGYRD